MALTATGRQATVLVERGVSWIQIAGEQPSMTGAKSRVYVDADACPFKDVIIAVASDHGLAVTMIANYCHEISEAEGVEVIRVDRERDAVDIAIANRAGPDDIVVTQDWGLAAMVLGKGARALSPRGRIYKPEAIESLLAVRHLEQKVRRAGGRTKGPPRLDRSDRERFRRALERLAGCEEEQ